MRHMRGLLPPWIAQDPELWRRSVEYSLESIAEELKAFCRGEIPKRATEVDAERAREAGRLGGYLNLLLSGYRSGHSAQLGEWISLIEERVDDPRTRAALLERGSRFFYVYEEKVAGFITDEYTRERDRSRQTLEQRRVNAVREVLAGNLADRGLLGYELESNHLALILWSPDGAGIARGLATRLDRRLLVLGVVAGRWWAWLGGDRPLELDVRSFVAEIELPVSGGISCGTELHGERGFRESHVQATGAMEMAQRLGRSRVSYDEVSLEILASADREQATRFVCRELRGIDGRDPRSARLRKTLRTYFEAGLNAAASATKLGIHEQTVAQRLRAIEDRTGREISGRRAELETALRLRDVVGGDEPTGD